MKRKNNFTTTSVSFEDFEQALTAPGAGSAPVDKLVSARMGLEQEARKKERELKKSQGKVLVLNFWFTECKPCVAEMPAMNRLQHQYAGKDVVFWPSS